MPQQQYMQTEAVDAEVARREWNMFEPALPWQEPSS